MREESADHAGSGKLILMTGVPGIGKSLIREKMLGEIAHLEIVEFGDIVHQTLTDVAEISRETLREAPDRYVSLSTLSQASRTLAERVSALRRKSDVIVIAHSTAKTDFGFYVIPEIRDVERINLDAIIVLHGSAEEIEKRLSARDSGKGRMTKEQLATSQQLLDSCAVSFSQRANCPMYIVDVHNEVTSTLRGLMRVLDHVGMNHALKKIDSP